MALLPLAVEARTEAAIDGEIDELMEVTIENAKHPEAAEHIFDAQRAGYPSILTLTEKVRPREGAESLEGIPKDTRKTTR